MKEDKSSDPDKVSPRLIIHLIEEICEPLCILFRQSLEEGCVPDDCRNADIVPICKSGTRSKPENYRPVSLTSQMCKVFEALLRDTSVEHLESNNLLNITQHGFRRGRSCLSNNILPFIEKVTEVLDKQENIDVLLLDFAKAFDKVPHVRLLNKVKNMGVYGQIFKWIEAWLKDRWQRFGFKGTWSTWKRVHS